MREIVGWLVEQICRPLDTKVCEISNATDDDAFPGFYLNA